MSGFEAIFEVPAVKKFAGERAGIVLHQEMVDGVAAAVHAADGLAAEDFGAQSIDVAGLDFFNLREADAVFVAEWQVTEQVQERANTALREQFGALRADTLEHADVGIEAEGNVGRRVGGSEHQKAYRYLYHCGADGAGCAPRGAEPYQTARTTGQFARGATCPTGATFVGSLVRIIRVCASGE